MRKPAHHPLFRSFWRGPVWHPACPDVMRAHASAPLSVAVRLNTGEGSTHFEGEQRQAAEAGRQGLDGEVEPSRYAVERDQLGVIAALIAHDGVQGPVEVCALASLAGIGMCCEAAVKIAQAHAQDTRAS